MTRKRKSKQAEGVELNLAAMLDMAFQLLTFFILTFRPPPVESQISLRMPPPHPLPTANATKQPGSDEKDNDPVSGFNTVGIWLTSDPDGSLARMWVGSILAGGTDKVEVGVDPALGALKDKLKDLLGKPDTPFEQVTIQVGSNLRYDELMRVIGVCSAQTVGGGSKLPGLSLVEGLETMPDAPK